MESKALKVGAIAMLIMGIHLADLPLDPAMN